MSLNGMKLHIYAGSGLEDIVDGPLRTGPARGVAAFAQPSGLTSDDRYLYIADSEGSSIRAIAFHRNGHASTLLGTAQLPKERRLFTFGDRDGITRQALLQHPLGVARWKNHLFIADTYNNKIKDLDLEKSTIRTLAGASTPGATDSPARFDEPAGLSVAADMLYVADTNNHLIRTIAIKNGGKVRTLQFPKLNPPGQSTNQKKEQSNSKLQETVPK